MITSSLLLMFVSYVDLTVFQYSERLSMLLHIFDVCARDVCGCSVCVREQECLHV